MTRLFDDYVYGEGPRAGCWWTETCNLPEVSQLDRDLTCDVAIIGGGFTGLNAAITLARSGLQVVVLEAKSFGWGASGRNGGFCCLGGGRIDDDSVLDQRYGPGASQAWRDAERAAVAHVDGLLSAHDLDVDRHSNGETWLAHRSKDMNLAEAKLSMMQEKYGVKGRVIAREALADHGLNAGFYGAVEVPIGFALNPRKYVSGLVAVAMEASANLFEKAPVESLTREKNGWHLRSGRHSVCADKVIVATNGYSSEHIPKAIAGRYMPAQSSIVVSRPLSEAERAAQGWTSRQMCYDSRNLLHYFRLLPDNRMLFGMRGGLGGTARSEARARNRVIRDFRRMFPAWADVELTHYWSGLVCLNSSGLPIVGPVPGTPGLYCAMGYHGNGVAMGSYCGHLIAQRILDETWPEGLEDCLAIPSRRFPFGRFRRVSMPLAYAAFALADL